MNITYENSPLQEIEKEAEALRRTVITVCATKVCEIAEINTEKDNLGAKLKVEGYGSNLGTVKSWFKSRIGDRDLLSMRVEIDDVVRLLIADLKDITTAEEQGDIQCWD